MRKKRKVKDESFLQKIQNTFLTYVNCSLRADPAHLSEIAKAIFSKLPTDQETRGPTNLRSVTDWALRHPNAPLWQGLITDQEEFVSVFCKVVARTPFKGAKEPIEGEIDCSTCRTDRPQLMSIVNLRSPMIPVDYPVRDGFYEGKSPPRKIQLRYRGMIKNRAIISAVDCLECDEGSLVRLHRCDHCSKFYISKTAREQRFCSAGCHDAYHNREAKESGKRKEYMKQKRAEGKYQ